MPKRRTGRKPVSRSKSRLRFVRLSPGPKIRRSGRRSQRRSMRRWKLRKKWR